MASAKKSGASPRRQPKPSPGRSGKSPRKAPGTLPRDPARRAPRGGAAGRGQPKAPYRDAGGRFAKKPVSPPIGRKIKKKSLTPSMGSASRGAPLPPRSGKKSSGPANTGNSRPARALRKIPLAEPEALPKKPQRGGVKTSNRIRFRDGQGRFVAQKVRYQKAVTMERVIRGKTYVVTEGKKVLTPRRVAQLLPREEFESLAPNYSPPVRVRPRAKLFTAWNVAGQVDKLRGIRGKTIRVTMNLLDGDKLRQVTFYRRVKRDGTIRGGLFRQMNDALNLSNVYTYNKKDSKFAPEDRKGRKVKFHSADIAVEL